MIVVTGVSGRVGGLVAAGLARRGVPFRAVTRDAGSRPRPRRRRDRAHRLRPAGHARGRARAGRPRLHGLDARAARAAAPTASGVRRRGDAAARSGGSSTSPSSAPTRAPRSSTHAPTARRRRCSPSSGIPFTAVRNGMYADEIATWFDADGRITGPGGDGAVSLTYRPELAEAIVELLVDPAHDERSVVTVTGREALTLAELAAVAIRRHGRRRTATSRSIARSGSRTAAPSAARPGRSTPGSRTTTASRAVRRASSATTTARSPGRTR